MVEGITEDSPQITPQSPQIAPQTAQIAPQTAPQCSAKGCRASAEWQLLWNNPKIHTPERRKTWLACAEHRTTLGSFLDARGFLREVTPFDSSDRAAVS
jgi:hypothetical protein